MLDVAGVEIMVGDTVAGAITGYNALRVYTVTGFTPKMVRLTYYDEFLGVEMKTNKHPDEVAVVKRLDKPSPFV